MSRPYDLPDYRLDPPEDPEPACDCDPDFEPDDDWAEDEDPLSRPRTREELEDAELDVHCAGCNRVCADDEQDWSDPERCPECQEQAS